MRSVIYTLHVSFYVADFYTLIRGLVSQNFT